MTTAIDLFAGLGGWSTGARAAGVQVLWAANHWPEAVKWHAANHQDTDHVCQDLHQANWAAVPRTDIGIASPCCQGHAKARGKKNGNPEHDASRSTAWAVPSAAEVLQQDAWVIENVPEFVNWVLYPSWVDAVYAKAVCELKDAMDLAYLTGQRPADVLVMRRDDIEGNALGVKQKKTNKKLRIMLEVDGVESGLGSLIRKILERNTPHGSPYLLLTDSGKRVSAAMLRHRWDDAREEAVKEAVAAGDQILAGRISQFQFRDIRPKAASEITDIDHASLLLGHTKGDITERVYRRVGALAKPTK